MFLRKFVPMAIICLSFEYKVLVKNNKQIQNFVSVHIRLATEKEKKKEKKTMATRLLLLARVLEGQAYTFGSTLLWKTLMTKTAFFLPFPLRTALIIPLSRYAGRWTFLPQLALPSVSKHSSQCMLVPTDGRRAPPRRVRRRKGLLRTWRSPSD